MLAGILSNEDIHAHDTVDVARIIAKVDATEGGEDAHEVGLPCGRGLDALALISSCNDGTPRHIERCTVEISSSGIQEKNRRGSEVVERKGLEDGALPQYLLSERGTELDAKSVQSQWGRSSALGECGEPIRLPRPVARGKRDNA